MTYRIVNAKPVAWIDADGQLYHEEPPINWCPPHTALLADTPPPSFSKLAEQISIMMTFANATLTERQQDVLAAALKTIFTPDQ